MPQIDSPHRKPSFSKELLQNKLIEYSERFPASIQVLEVGGVHPNHTEAIINPYMAAVEGQPVWDTEDFKNVGEHCVAVAYAAEQMANALKGAGCISQSDVDFIVGRSLVHDANKRFEVMRRKAKAAGVAIDIVSRQAYETIGPILAEKGIDPRIIEYMQLAGKETGHTSLSDFVVLDEEGNVMLNPARTIAEQIIHLADDMTHSPFPNPDHVTHFVPIAERMELSQFTKRYPFLYQEGFGFRADGSIESTKEANCPEARPDLKQVRTYADWQQGVARMISSHLQLLRTGQNIQNPELFWQDTINAGLPE